MKNFFFADKKIIALIILIGIIFSTALNNSIDVGDSSHYLVGAKSIAEGYGYRDISLNLAPPLTYYPPAYSAVLAPILFIFKESLLFAKFLSILFVLASLVIVNLLFKKFFSEKISFIMTTAFALNLLVLWYSHRILTESVFLFFTLISIFFILKYSNEKMLFSKNYFISVIFAIISVFTRTIGISLSISAVLIFVFRKQFKKALLILLPSLFFFLLWAFIANSNSQLSFQSGSYFEQVFLKDVFDNQSGTVSVSEFFLRALQSAYFYLFESVPQTVFSLFDVTHYIFGNNVFLYIASFIVGLIVLLGFFSSISKKHNLIHGYSALYFIILFFWPYIDTSAVNRFLLPVLPFLFIFFAVGIEKLSALFKINKTNVLVIVFSLNILFSAGSDFVYLSTIQERQFNSDYNNFLKATEWIKENTGENDIFWSSLPQRTFLLTGRNVINSQSLLKQDILKDLKKNNVSFVFVTAVGSEGTFQKRVEQISTHLTEVFTGLDGKTRIYRFEP